MSSYSTNGKLAGFSAADAQTALQKFAEDADHGKYNRTILIGLGGTGAKALQHLRQMKVERFGTVEMPGVAYLSIDTDVQSAEQEATKARSPYHKLVAFQEAERIDVSSNVNAVLNNMARHPHIKEWWDDSTLDSEKFDGKGAGQIRPLSRLVFFQNRELMQTALERCWSTVTVQNLDDSRVRMGKVRVIVIAGLAGGTGSGMALDIAALIRATFEGRAFELDAHFVLPGVYKTADAEFGKLGANGYAALRELNHHMSHPFSVQWDHHAKTKVSTLYDRIWLISGTNALSASMTSPSDAYRAIGESLFLDFAGGPMKGWVEGVRVNREQYLTSFVGYNYRIEDSNGRSVETHADEYKTAFCSMGISKLVYPSWRMLNYAKYDLAAEMVRLLDPGRGTPLGDLITQPRTRFMLEGNFFQGVVIDDDGSKDRRYQVRDALAKLKGARTDANTIFEHILELNDELIGLADEMFHEKSTVELGREHDRLVRKLYGDPYSKGNEGDWALQIKKNREAYVREVKSALPKLINDRWNKPGIGITGTREILESILEELRRPHDKALFIEWLRHMRAEKQQEAAESKAEWERLLRNTHQSSKGLFPSADNHKAALELAGEAFATYWRAKVTEYICFEGVIALEAIEKLIKAEIVRMDGIVADMQSLEGYYLSFRESFSEPIRSTLFIEVPVQKDFGTLLEPFLGSDDAQRRERLEQLLTRTLRNLGVFTLEGLSDQLGGKLDSFRDRLAGEAFFALKGDENGLTTAFNSSEDDEAQEGFLRRYSIMNALEGMPKSELADLLKQLYEKGLPWIERTPKDPTGGVAKPVPDAFLGLPEVDGRFADELLSTIKRYQPNNLPFRPQKVATNDPSELVFYTEWSAFAAYYVGELHGSAGLRAHYHAKTRDKSAPAALHIHTDWHTYQELVPLEENEVRDRLRAWQLFIKAQMLGLICTRRRRLGDDERVNYTRRRRSTALDVNWSDLGPQAPVIAELTGNRNLTHSLTSDVEERIRGFLDRGSYAHLVALVDYWQHGIFPLANPSEAGTDVIQPRGSLQNKALDDLRREWRQLALRELKTNDALDSKLRHLLMTLGDWTVPIYKSPGLPVPTTADLADELRVSDWTPLDAVREHVNGLVFDRKIREHRDAYGQLQTVFPRLAVDWSKFSAVEDFEPEAETATEYWYAGPNGKESGLTATQVAAKVQAAPSARHRVFATGWDAWQNAQDVEPIAAILQPVADEGPPADVGETEYHYAQDGARRGKQSASAVAQAVADAPSSTHKVWIKDFGKAWRDARDVPEIAALMPEEPPPLDVPPPLDEDEPPPLD